MRAGRALVALSILLSSAVAHAQDPRSEPAARANDSGAERATVERRGDEGRDSRMPRRPMPDYGRAPEHEDPVEALLWIPRIVFFPVHLVLEYVVRLPLAWLLRTIELERLDALFTDGIPQLERRDTLYWFVPLFRYDHVFQPSVGLAFYLRDSSERFRLRLGLAFWGDDQVRGEARGSARFDRGTIALNALGSYRKDRIFQGLGWSSSRWLRTRYAEALFDAVLSVTGRPWRKTELSAGLRAGVRRFGDTNYRRGDDRSLDQAIATGLLPPPPGYPEGYTAVETWAHALLDTRRDDDWTHSTGIRAELAGAWAFDAERGLDANWVRAELDLELALEVMRERTIALRSFIAIVEELGPGAVPFTEQVWLGGALMRMPGFLSGQLIGESAVMLGLSWRYAIAAWLDAALFADVGNVFAAHFSDFEIDRLRLSFGTAVTARDPDDFTLIVAFGTDPFALGTDVSSFRFAIAVGAPP